MQMSNAMQMPSCSWLWIFARFAGLVGSAVAAAGAANHALVLPFATHDLWHCDRCRCGCVCVCHVQLVFNLTKMRSK